MIFLDFHDDFHEKVNLRRCEKTRTVDVRSFAQEKKFYFKYGWVHTVVPRLLRCLYKSMFLGNGTHPFTDKQWVGRWSILGTYVPTRRKSAGPARRARERRKIAIQRYPPIYREAMGGSVEYFRWILLLLLLNLLQLLNYFQIGQAASYLIEY